VARRVQSNIRELEGALNRIIAFADLSGQSLTPELVEAALADLLPQRQTILPERIVELVAREWKTTSEAILGRDRSQRVAEPRQVAMYLMRKETDASLPRSARSRPVGSHDRNVRHSQDRKQIETKAELRKGVINVKQRLYGQGAVV
jgi:chromosomal replication initiator protein